MLLLGLLIGGISGISAEQLSLSKLPAFVEQAFLGALIGYALGGAVVEEWWRIGVGMALGAILALGTALSIGPLTFASVANTFFVMFVCGLIAKNWGWRGAIGALISGALSGAFIGLLLGLSQHMTGLSLIKTIGATALCLAIILLLTRTTFGAMQPKAAVVADTPAAKIHAWTQVLILDRGNSEAYYKRGLLYAAQGEFDLARADFHRTHETSGDQRWHGLAEQALRQLDQAARPSAD